MALIYCRSTDGSDADNGSTWALAKATLAGALAIAAAGDTIYVSHVHAETQAGAMTLTSLGTAAAKVNIICANDGAEPPTAAASSATVTVSGTVAITFAGFAYCRGVQFITSADSSNANINFFGTAAAAWWKIENGALKLGTGSSDARTTRLNIGGSNATVPDQLLELVNTPITFGGILQSISVRCPFRWSFTASAIVGDLPTVLFTGAAVAPYGQATLVGVDLSALGSGQSLVSVGAGQGRFLFRDCKLGASVAPTTGTHPGQGGPVVEVINSDSADTNSRFYRQDYQATEQQETGIIRTGGASDGVTPVSRKVVTSANASVVTPYRSMPIAVWNTAIGSALTVTIPGLTDNLTLKNNEAWLEVEGLTTSGFPLGGLVSSRVADPIFGTPANNPTDASSSWASAPGTPVKQSLAVAITPQEIGLLRVYVCVAKPSTTLYYDPLVQIT